ncbi:MAG: FAD:protein FMN transferase [Acidimicrobiales bacterium]
MSRDPVAAFADEAEAVGHIRAMASDINVRAVRACADLSALPDTLIGALRVFSDVETACTRFDPCSPLMQANADPTQAHRVPKICFEALCEAFRCYEATGGMFDPRVMGDLVALGYDRSLPFSPGDVGVPLRRSAPRGALPRWSPRLRHEEYEVVLGPHPVDLGGIGKGLAVRWASQTLRPAAPDHLVEAGGDCYCSGRAPDSDSWLVAVEDPFGSTTPRAVLALSDRACATSSIRLRRWIHDGEPVHHLVDPRSGKPGGDGLRAVSVVMDDPADAEVWAKVLFLAGESRIESVARDKGLAALWVDDEGATHLSAAIEPFVRWGPW